MENDNKKFYFNLSLFGPINSGKCTLAKSISIANNSISRPNTFSLENHHFNILGFPCHPNNEYEEKYDLCSSVGDLSVFIFSPEILDDTTSIAEKYSHEVLRLLHKGVKHFIFVLNKIDSYDISEEHFKKFVALFKLEYLLNIYSDIFLVKPQIYFMPISAKEIKNIDENINHEKRYSWYKGDSLFQNLITIADDLLRISEELRKKPTIFIVYDSYRDEDYYVISGKLLEGKISTKIEYKLSSIKFSIIVEKISDCQGNYVDHIYPLSFASVTIYNLVEI
jgi:translation elongation factor EF-1alpha